MKIKQIDIHTHVISLMDTGDRQFGKFSKWIDKKPRRLKIVQKILEVAGDITGVQELKRYSLLLDYLDNSTEDKIKMLLLTNDMIVINTMDMSFSGCGECDRSYEAQLDELIELKKKYPIKIFMHLNPMRPYMLELVKKYQEYVDGWKVYPPLNGYPTNHNIKYALCLYPKPVTIHCTNSSPIYYKGDDINELIDWSHFTSVNGSKKEKAQSFGHPYWIAQLAKCFPNINFNAAHGGGVDLKWRGYVKKYCKEIPNFYTDSSFTFGDLDEDFDTFFKDIETKVLFGTDSIMRESYTLNHMEQMQKNNRKFLSI